MKLLFNDPHNWPTVRGGVPLIWAMPKFKQFFLCVCSPSPLIYLCPNPSFNTSALQTKGYRTINDYFRGESDIVSAVGRNFIGWGGRDDQDPLEVLDEVSNTDTNTSQYHIIEQDEGGDFKLVTGLEVADPMYPYGRCLRGNLSNDDTIKWSSIVILKLKASVKKLHIYFKDPVSYTRFTDDPFSGLGDRMSISRTRRGWSWFR